MMRLDRIVDSAAFDFPLSEKDLWTLFSYFPSSDLEGLKHVRVTCPLNNEDYQRFARYDSFHSRIYLFAHRKKGEFFHFETLPRPLRLTREQFRRQLVESTVPHEVGHHVAWRDSRMMECSYADAYAARFRQLDGARLGRLWGAVEV